jgi:hypothetical protein
VKRAEESGMWKGFGRNAAKGREGSKRKEEKN